MFFANGLTAAVDLGGKDIHISFVKNTKRSAFAEDNESFQVDFDRKVTWVNGPWGLSQNANCTNEAGEKIGDLSDAEVKVLAQAAIEAILSLEKDPENTAPQASRPENAQSTTLKVLVGEDIYSVRVHTSNPQYQKFLDVLETYQEKLRIHSLIRMQGQMTKNGDLKVVFSYFGKKPFHLIIPKKAGEAFRLGNAQLEYLIAPTREEFVLSSKSKRLELNFKLKKNAEALGKQIQYSNRLILHHVPNDAVKGQLPPTVLNLCSDLQ